MQAIPRTERTTTADLLRALRDWHPSHNERVEFYAALSANVMTAQCGLTQDARLEIVGYNDCAVEAIDQDLCNQQAEQAWEDSKRRRAV